MEKIKEKKIYKHNLNLRYRVEKILLDATGYEKGIEPKRVVLYTQLETGKFPAGTVWVREEQDFKENFKEE
ncbi:hypothetical protein H6501_05440 [Candidatus Woesearchaeota archaeon]|nr:hypothetical protein [Nanoarchaeota archaeon]MCB9371018.1 hypothetical protein [Candidatus Woesearchaeota archaeon]USN44129.1 MAG: hypothetical protein H6500_07115 [Candidatus Woesearchaeota archaeon]